jgi:hypothetical protein
MYEGTSGDTVMDLKGKWPTGQHVTAVDGAICVRPFSLLMELHIFRTEGFLEHCIERPGNNMGVWGSAGELNYCQSLNKHSAPLISTDHVSLV